jgi:glycosyltransferase involved in cell wall biosynthesis
MDFLFCGNFGLTELSDNGQVSKTRSAFNYLLGLYGNSNVKKFDFSRIRKKPVRTFFSFLKAVKHAKCLVVVPGDKNLLFMSVFLPRYIKRCGLSVFYLVVGGYLDKFYDSHKSVRKFLPLLTGIFPEAESLTKALRERGLTNVETLPNFSFRKPIDQRTFIDSLAVSAKRPLRFCIFSRICEAKGIVTAIKAIKIVNEKLNGDERVFLDIYGPIDKAFSNTFAQLLNESSGDAKYCGFLGQDALGVLCKYFALLFPSYYEGEGFPGTISDSLFSGLPVIVSDWKYNSEIIKDGVTGLVFLKPNESGAEVRLAEKILFAINNEQLMQVMRKNCMNESLKYLPENAMKPLTNKLSAIIEL